MEATSQTLYINNLVEKKSKHDIKKMLYMLFSQYGKVIEIVACKGLKLRGQVIFVNWLKSLNLIKLLSIIHIIGKAWIVFENPVSAAKAMKEKQDFNFYGKPMVCYNMSFFLKNTI